MFNLKFYYYVEKQKVKAIGLLSTALGLGLNMQYAWNDYSFKESPLLVRVVMAEMESGMCVGRGGGLQWEKVQGNRCSCKNPLSGYSGKLGCNLTWETACKQ